MKLLIPIVLLFLSVMLPTYAVGAPTTGNPLLNVKQLGTDFNSDNVRVEIQAPTKESLLINLKTVNSGEVSPNNLDKELGVKFKGVTITVPNNSTNIFTAPVDQTKPLNSLKIGVGLMLTPPGITPPSVPGINTNLPPININIDIPGIPGWLRETIKSGDPVNVEVQRELVDLTSTGKSPTEKDWAKIVGTTDIQLEEQEQEVNSLLKSSIRTKQAARITQQALNAPIPPAASSFPTFPPSAPASTGVISAGGVPCGDNLHPGFKTAIGCIHTNPIELAGDVSKFIVAISGGLAFLLMLMGVFQMLTSAGNPDSLNAGRERLTSAIIGLLFVIFAVLFMQIIGIGFLNLPGFEK